MVELIILMLFLFGVYLIVSLSLNLEFGYAGIPNFGRALAVLVGAITVGGILNRLLIWYYGIPGDLVSASGEACYKITEVIANDPIVGLGILVLSIVIAMVLSSIVGAIFILPSSKLKGDYLGVTLLAISEVAFFFTYYNTSIMGGYYGVSAPDILAFAAGGDRTLYFTILTLVIAFLVYLLSERLLNTPYGRFLRAHRENEDIVKAFGRDIMKIRIKSVAVGSAIAAIAGVLYAFYSSNVIGNAFTRVEWTFFPFLIVLLGGRGNNKGIILGTIIFVMVRVLLETYKFELRHILNLPFEAVWLEYVFFGVLALLVLFYKSEGLLKEKPIMTEPIKNLRK